MRTRLIGLIAAALIAATAATERSEAASPVSITTTIEKEVVVRDPKGDTKTTRVPADKVIPGETVVFTYTITNVGPTSAEDIMVVAAIPAETAYVDKSAAAAQTAVMFSIDKAKSFAAPEKLEVVGADGKRRRAGPADYTHLRWRLTTPLATNAAKTVSFRTILK